MEFAPASSDRLALAGRTGARLAAGLGLPTSRSTLLRLVHALPDPPVGAVQVLGVDDFALRRGRRYATVLIDAVTHRRVDVLPDRRARPWPHAWLGEHPGVGMVCRDGSATYAEAVRQGAPGAVQIGNGHGDAVEHVRPACAPSRTVLVLAADGPNVPDIGFSRVGRGCGTRSPTSTGRWARS